jgi:hypothetical protein
MFMITTLSEYISYKITPRSEKDYKASNIIVFILSVAWTASTGDDRRRDLPSFLPLAWASHQGSIMLLHLWQQKASWSRLMVATQQVGEKDDMGALDKERLVMDWLAESGGCILCQASMTNAKSSSPWDATSNIPQSPLR